MAARRVLQIGFGSIDVDNSTDAIAPKPMFVLCWLASASKPSCDATKATALASGGPKATRRYGRKPCLPVGVGQPKWRRSRIVLSGESSWQAS